MLDQAKIAEIRRGCRGFELYWRMPRELVYLICDCLHGQEKMAEAYRELEESLDERDRTICAFAAKTVVDGAEHPDEIYCIRQMMDHPGHDDESCPFPPWVPVRFARELLEYFGEETAAKFEYK